MRILKIKGVLYFSLKLIEMLYLKNDLLNIAINPIGAELSGITSIKNHTPYMWDGDPDIWANYAPNLFPIVGMLKDNTYHYEGSEYHMPKHGFIRNNPDFKVVTHTETQLKLRLVSNEETLRLFPFKFQYDVVFELSDHKLSVSYHVTNLDNNTMYFSLGGHPAFKCPIFEDETYDDYQIVFENDETSETYLLNLQNGLVTTTTKPVFDTLNRINIHHRLFEHDALVFKDLKSRKVTLKSMNHGAVVSLHFDGFPYFGIWAKPNGDYVCLEPWMGIADSEDSNQQLTEKEGIMSLEADTTFEAIYTIEIHTAHLV